MSEGKENPAIITNDTEEGVASLSVTELSTTAEADSVSYEDKNSSPTTTVEMGSFGSKLIKPQRTDESQAVKRSGESGYSSQSGQSRKAENSKSEDVAAKREMYIHMPVEQKREQYLCGKNYVTLSDVPTWVNYKTTSKLESQLPKRKGRRGSLPDANSIVEIYEPCAEINKRISVWRGDITKLEIDCIVNAANNSLLGGGGVDGAIHWAASRLLYHECKTLNGCETGDVKVTAGYKLPARCRLSVEKLSTVMQMFPQFHHEYIWTNEILTIQFWYRLLTSFKRGNVEAFPCISTGVYGYPNDRAVEVVLHTTRQFLERLNKRNELSKVDRIVFCLFLDVDVGLYEQRMPFYFPRPTTPSTVETPLNLQSSGAPRGAGSHMPPSHEGKDIRDVASDFDRTKSGSAAGTTAPTTPQSGNVSSLESNSSVDTDSKNLAPTENLPHADGSVARNDNFVRPSTEDTPSEICYQVSDMQIKDESDRLQTNQSSLTDDKNVALGTSDCCRSTVEEAAKDVHAPEQASSGSDVDKPAAGDGPDGTVCGNTPPEQSDQAGGRVESHGSDVLSHL